MKITLKHKKLGYEVAIVTPHNDPDKIFSLNIDNSDLMTELASSYGHYGHLIDPKYISNLDLQSAIYQLRAFAVIGADPLIAPNPLPKGAIS